MCGGVIYYTPDITVARPVWREVWDVTTASRKLQPQVTEGAGCTGAGWVQTSPDDKYLYHAVIGRGPGTTGSPTPQVDAGAPKQVYMLDISKLVYPDHPQCSIDTVHEVSFGGDEPDCPTLSDTFHVEDHTSGGPHWGAFDNFRLRPDGYYEDITEPGATKTVSRIAFSDYFVARTSADGNHKLCILNVGADGRLTLDADFVDEHEGTSCVEFNRTSWPHGDFGDAKPHSMIFVVPDDDVHSP